MSIQTVFANLSCSQLETSIAWYEKLFGKAPSRRPMPGLAEWHFTDSAQVQRYEEKRHAGHGTLTLGVIRLQAERQRLIEAGLQPGAIEEANAFSIMRMRDPDNNLIVFASTRR